MKQKYPSVVLCEHVSREYFNWVIKQYENEWVAKIKLSDLPLEDAFTQSFNYPIFCVADGVLLEPKPGGKYPNPSGASLVAQEFVKMAKDYLEKDYPKVTLETIKKAFIRANQAIGKTNRRYNHYKRNSNFLDFDLFCTTGTVAVILKNKLYWGSIADSFVAVFSKNGKLKFRSPDGWRHMKFPKDFKGWSWQEQRTHVRKYLRNGIIRDKKIGYGVLNGEAKAMKYLDSGVVQLNTGDLIVVGTDGYEHNIKVKSFIKLLREIIKEKKGAKSKLRELEKILIKKNPDKYGHERTLLAVKVILS